MTVGNIIFYDDDRVVAQDSRLTVPGGAVFSNADLAVIILAASLLH